MQLGILTLMHSKPDHFTQDIIELGSLFHGLLVWVVPTVSTSQQKFLSMVNSKYHGRPCSLVKRKPSIQPLLDWVSAMGYPCLLEFFRTAS